MSLTQIPYQSTKTANTAQPSQPTYKVRAHQRACSERTSPLPSSTSVTVTPSLLSDYMRLGVCKYLHTRYRSQTDTQSRNHMCSCFAKRTNEETSP
mmetsp:Transcript_15554/g.42993  ORF Transcript_15554/g.42993 Transcript_15554/m.42993 type:complete len:96 (+) Transcript_15554:208-495(+)